MLIHCCIILDFFYILRATREVKQSVLELSEITGRAKKASQAAAAGLSPRLLINLIFLSVTVNGEESACCNRVYKYLLLY